MKYRIKVSIFAIFFSIGIGQYINAQNPVYYSSDQRQYDRGVELYEEGHYNSAISSFESYLERDDQTHETWAKYYNYSAHLHLFHPNATAQLARFADQNQNHFTSKLAYFQLGSHYYANSDYDEAIRYYSEVDRDELSDEDRAELNFKLAYSYFSKKNFKKALGLFESVKIRNNKYQSACIYYASYIYLENENWPKAINSLEKLKSNKKYSNVIPGMYAKALYNNGDYDEVIEYGESTLTKSKNAQLALYVGSAFFDKGNYKKAAKYLEWASPKERETSYRLGYAQFQEEMYADAIQNFKNVMIPDDSVAQVSAYYLGHSYQKTEQKDLAATAYKQAYLLNFNKQIEKEALYNYGMLSFESGNYANSIIGFTKLLELYPDSKNVNRAREALSDAYLKSDNYEDALRYLTKIRNKSDKIKRAHQNAAYMLAVKYYNCKDFQKTEEYLDQAFLFTTNSLLKASSYFLKAEMLSQQGDFNQAILNYSGLFQADSKRQSEYYNKSRYGIAHAYYNNKEFSKAESHYKYFIDQEANRNEVYYEAMIRYADCQYIQKRYDKAADLYKEAASGSRYLADYALFQSGVMYFFAKNPEESRARFSSLVKKYPNSGYADNAIFQAGIASAEMADYEGAISDFTTLLNKYPNSDLVPFALEKRGISYSNIGDNTKAKPDFVRIIDEFPSHQTAKSVVYSLQETLNKLGQSDQFDGYLAKYKAANPDDTNVESIEYENAKNLYALEKYNKGANAFEQFIKTYSNSSFVDDALYYQGECLRLDKQYEKAIETFEKVIEDNKSYYVGRAIYKCADLYLNKQDFDKAKVKYQTLLDYSSKNKDKVRGYKGLMHCEFGLADFEKTVWRANDLINKTSARSRDVHQAYLLRGQSKLQLNQDSSAIEDFSYVMSNSKKEQGAEATYRIANYYYSKKLYEQSIKTLRSLNENFASYDLWLGKSFLLIAENYIATDENYQAKATLVSLIEKSENKQTVKLAKQRLEWLENQQDEAVSDTLLLLEEEVDLDEIDGLQPDTLKEDGE